MIIGLAGQKGGSGKTTVSICIADELHRRGQSILLIDADPQGTVTTWAAQRNEDGPEVQRWPELLITKPSKARTALSDAAEGFDHVVIDPPPKADEKQVVLLALVDLAILPCGSGYQDVWSMSESIELVAKVAAARDDLRAKILINQAKRTVLSRQVRKALEDVDLDPLDAMLSDYVAFQECIGQGVGVTRYSPDSKAAKQVRQLVDEVLAR